MKKQDKPDKIDCERIIRVVNRFRENLWPFYQKERLLVNYYNAGPVPDEELCEDAPISLGLGNRYIKAPYDKLMDMILMEPGFIKTEICYPLKAQRIGMVQRALDKELNAIIHERMESTFRKIAGRALITGRAFLYRLSRWDWMFQSGRLLHDFNAPDDVSSEDFREWAFSGRMTLRSIDERLESTREYQGVQEGYGWNRQGLAALKQHILETTADEKDRANTRLMEQRLLNQFDEATSDQPLDVYWYFRKNGIKNHFGKEGVDLYCVSRFNSTASIARAEQDGIVYRSLSVTTKDGDQTLYYLPNAFESVEECLIPFLLDSRVDGEQEMAQIDGTGKQMVPRLMSMEMLAGALTEGISFGVAPHWKMAANVDKEDAKKLAKSGLSPWDIVPAGLEVMAKNNSMTGLNAGLAMLQSLGVSAEADAQTGESSPMGGGDNAKFKVEAMQQAEAIQMNISRRMSRFFKFADRLAQAQVETMCRPLDLWRAGDAGYFDVRTFQTNMLLLHRCVPAEYSSERMKGTCRRLASGGDAAQTVQQSTRSIQLYGGQIGPQGVAALAREGLRAIWGDSFVDSVLMPEIEQPVPDQVMAAQVQNAQAMIALQPPPRLPTDNIGVHLPIHMQGIQAQMQAIQQQGSMTAEKKMGVTALLQHAMMDAAGLPPQQQQQLSPAFKKLIQVLSSIPVSGAGSQLELQQQEQQRKMMDSQFKQKMGDNLMQDRNAKSSLAQNKFMLEMQKFLEQQKNNGVVRAGQLLAQMETVQADKADHQFALPMAGQ